MSSKRVCLSGLLLWVVVGSMGCATGPPFDYSTYREHMPRSILVLPPLNESVEVGAPYAYLTTLTQPVAERGYYVFPVSVIDAFMKENGMPTPGEMHAVSLNKIEEIIGADAVLYITIVDWGQKYQVVSSQTVVAVKGRRSTSHRARHSGAVTCRSYTTRATAIRAWQGWSFPR